MKAMKGRVVALTGLLFACDEAREPFDLDALVEPATQCVTVVHESLDLGGPLHRFVGDSLGSPGGWGLVTLADALVVVRVPASTSEQPTAPIQLGLPDEFANDVELRVGVDGELWVLSQAGIVSLRRVLPELGEVARNDLLANFPVPDQEQLGGCPTAHTRSLMFVEARPYLLALPDCADGPALVLHLLALERETLDYEISWQLAFDPCDGEQDPITCALIHAYSLESIGAAGSTPHTELERVAVGFTQVRSFSITEFLVRSAHISLLDMRVDESGPHARLLSFPNVWNESLPFLLSPVDVTRDPYSTQLHVRNYLHDEDAALARLDTIAGQYDLLTHAEQLPLSGRGRLVQLDNSGAMLEVEDGALRAVSLRDWPNWPTTHTLLELDDLVDFEVGGVGQLLLRREEAPPQVVHVACVQ
jgi:hypothetical protein